jgi:drug/metabolite transporter (DMT)-like permease
MKTSRVHRHALLMMVGATLCWSSAGTLVRSMQMTDSWEITLWRSVFMSVFVGGWLWQQHRSDAWSKIHAVGLPGLISAALLTIMFISFIIALSHTTVANVLIVASSAPFFAALAGWLLLRERVSLQTGLAMIAAFSGIVVMFVGAITHERWVGALIAAVIPVAYGLNVALLRKMHATVDMIPAILLAGLLSAAVTLPFALPFEAAGRDLLLLAIMGSVQLGLGCVLMTIASRNLVSAEIGLLSILETVFGILLTWALVGEQPSGAALVGGAIVIGALAINQFIHLRRHEEAAPAVIT